MGDDIAPILNKWLFDPEKTVRRIVGKDGLPKLQVRLPLGLEQYELEGRPDGLRPQGMESYLHVCQSRLGEHVREHGADDGFVLTEDDCNNLRRESMLYYFRYLLCFQIGDYPQVELDTERNMAAFRIVHEHAERDEDRIALDQYWPYVIRMNAMARAMRLIEETQLPEARGAVKAAIEEIEGLAEVSNETFALEKMRSLGVLQQMAEELQQKCPPDEREIVRERLRRAVAVENYERAAQLRDLLRSMEG